MRRSRRLAAVGGILVGSVVPASGWGQETALSPQAAPPSFLPFKIEGQISAVLENGNPVATTVKGGSLSSLDLTLRADTITFTRDLLRIEATGHVVVTRGDETLRGDDFVFEAAEGDFGFKNATVVSPPYFIRVLSAERRGTTATADGVYFVPSSDGKGEFHIRARRLIAQTDTRTLILEKPSFYLFGTRILTLRRYKLRLQETGERSQRRDTLSLPLSLRTSQIGGLVIGVNLPFVLGQDFVARAAVDLPLQRAAQSLFSVEKEWRFASPSTSPDPRSNFLFLGDGQKNANISPLRGLLTARPKPLPPDPLLAFNPVLGGSLFPDLRGGTTASIRVRGIFTANQEVTERRRGLLLLSRQPEVGVTGFYPLGTHSIAADPILAKRELRRLRPALTGSVLYSAFREQQVEQGRQTSRTHRAALSFGVQTLPLLVGDRLLLRGQITRTEKSVFRQ